MSVQELLPMTVNPCDDRTMETDRNDIKLNDELKQELANAAKEFGRPWPEVFRNALRDYRSKVRVVHSGNSQCSLFDALSEDGLIGTVKDSPPDLSTNPKYMEGFGRGDGTGVD